MANIFYKNNNELEKAIVPIDNGGTGADNAQAARNNLGAVSKFGDNLNGAIGFNSSSANGSWINGKNLFDQIPIHFYTKYTTNGGRYDPLIAGQDEAGNIWNFGQGADQSIGFCGFLKDTTANKTDWRVSINTLNGGLSAPNYYGTWNGNTISATKGGTGQTSLQATRSAMGLGNTTGALPVANGGTGVTASDPVIAWGTSGNWNYIKFASKRAICWYTSWDATISCTATSNVQSSYVTLPFNFSGNYNNVAFVSGTGREIWVRSAYVDKTTANHRVNIRWSLANNSATTVGFNILVCGIYA